MSKKTIFIVDDDKRLCALWTQAISEEWGHNVVTFNTGDECIKALPENPDLILLDIVLPGKTGIQVLKEIKERLPDLPILILSAQQSIDIALEAIRNGAMDYLSKPVEVAKLGTSIRNALHTGELTREIALLRETIEHNVHFDNIISMHGSMQEIFKVVHKIKDSKISVLIQGESGTGKELIAKAIHYNGVKKDNPFVVVNCASIPKDLLESELFGHERGAFTGALFRRIGKFEMADGGTLFFDEIGELDLNLQAKLLRVLESKEFERVGGNEVLRSDVRIISATNKDLKKAVEEKTFREDLFFRLASFPIYLPPLRERQSDIPLLTEYFLKRASASYGKPNLRIAPKALSLLSQYPWPGNVRELQYAIERAAILCDSDIITENEFASILIPALISPESLSSAAPSSAQQKQIVPLETLIEDSLRHALEVTEGNIIEVARGLKIGRATVYRLMEKYQIKK